MNAYFTLIKEKGPLWFLNRSLYSIKLKLLNALPKTELLFEKHIPEVVRITPFDYQPEAIASYLETLPENEKKRIIDSADLACQGIIKGFSSVEMDYHMPIQWQLNPLTGKSCDEKKKWYQIPDFDKERGDIKAIWEISRFSHFFLLARAFLLSQNTKYANAYFEQIDSWVKGNPYSYGANYKCGQECALRLISVLLTYKCFQRYAEEHDVENIKSIINGSYKKILSNFFYAYHCIKNNHTISELVGMIIAAWCCKDEKRISHAYKTLEKVIQSQFSSDGGYIQQSFNYQRLALMDLEILLSLDGITGHTLSANAKDRILKSALQIFQCQDQTGDVPNYGSNDGALILPLTIGGYRDYKPGINAIHALIQGECLYKDFYLKEELLWLNIVTMQQTAETKGKRISIDYPESGLSVFRNDQYWMMVVCKEKLHHMDNGHIDLWIDGHNVLCDAGSYSYDSELGRELYTNKSHNTAYCDGLGQIRRIGSFAVYGQPTIKKRLWSENQMKFDIQYSTGYEHKRKISVTEYGYEIDDEVLSNKQDCFIQYHVLGGVTQIDSNSIMLEGCIMRFNAPVDLSKSKRSLYYFQTDDTTCVSVRCDKKLHTTIEIIGERKKK